MVTSSRTQREAGLGLGPKFFLAVSSLLLFFVILILGIELVALRERARTQTAQVGASLANTIGTLAGHYVLSERSVELQRIVADLQRESPSIEYIDFVGANGRVLAKTGRRGPPRALDQLSIGERSADRIAREGTQDLHLYVRPFLTVNPAGGWSAVGKLRLAVNQKGVIGLRRRALYTSVVVILIGLAMTYGLTQLGYRKIVHPILGLSDSAREISTGNLTRRNRRLSSDELGSLGSTFNQMAENLERTVVRISSAQTKLKGVGELVSSRSNVVLTSTDDQRLMTDRAYLSIEELNGGIRKITENVEALSASSEETSSSMLEMAASMEEVSRHTDSLFTSVEETASATQQMVSSIKEVDQNVDFLENFVTETSSSMAEMNVSINQVQLTAARSYDLALAVADAAQGGMKAVRETVDGMEQIRRSVEESNAVMIRLGDRSQEIGKILNVIEDVAEQTNLLALNAAILAAQAGEHGRGFSVVAGQIRDLSERTASSTKEIGSLIGSVQGEVRNGLEAISRGLRTAGEGVNLSHEAGRALNRILESASKASDMGKEIARATRDQAAGSEAVSLAVTRLGEMVGQLNSATTQQATGSSHILRAVESMREVTRYLRQATAEQKTGSVMISGSADKMIEMVHEIFQVAANQSAESEKIVHTMEEIRKIADANRGAAAEMATAVTSLNEAIRALNEEVRKFKVA